MFKSLAACVLVLVVAGSPAAHTAELPDDEMTGYLVQSVCLDQADNVIPLLPIESACERRRPQTRDDRATYRKHDWPDRTDPRHPLTGYQASDSVIDPAGSYIVIIQTFDFGDTRRAFGRFDAGQGDGGQALLLTGGWASIAMTEDGGDGVQWFVGDDCHTARPLEQHFLGWLLFRNDMTDQWHAEVTHLNKARSSNDCPSHFNTAYTRYRTAKIQFPFRLVDSDDNLKMVSLPVNVVISEHYGGATIAGADHLERFYFGKDLGLVRWERWAHPALFSYRNVAAEAGRFERSGRCPKLDVDETLDTDWKLVDCRTWTTFVAQHEPWSVAEYRWQAPEPLEHLKPR